MVSPSVVTASLWGHVEATVLQLLHEFAVVELRWRPASGIFIQDEVVDISQLVSRKSVFSFGEPFVESRETVERVKVLGSAACVDVRGNLVNRQENKQNAAQVERHTHLAREARLSS